jgi:hypothetical protein
MGMQMTDSKIDVTVGAVRFAGEGDQAWLAEQLDKVLQAAPKIATVQNTPAGTTGGGKAAQPEGGELTTTLASYIKEKGGETSQVDRFLIAADWLRRRGASKLTTVGVTKALKDNHQKRLANSADCLNKNVSKGYCEKADGGFFITPEGLKKLGH